MKKIAVSIAFILFVTSVFAQPAPSIQDEKIAGFSVDTEQMTFTVWNTGYTDKSSFELEVVSVGSVYQIKLVRIRRDYGKMMPQRMEITFTQEDLKGRLDLRNDNRILNTFSILNF